MFWSQSFVALSRVRIVVVVAKFLCVSERPRGGVFPVVPSAVLVLQLIKRKYFPFFRVCSERFEHSSAGLVWWQSKRKAACAKVFCRCVTLLGSHVQVQSSSSLLEGKKECGTVEKVFVVETPLVRDC